MNNIETERLVRRIVAILKGEGDPAMASKLAEDYQAACAAVAVRLEQCRSMIDAGASVQAIQVAETQPNLLDLVAVLEFRQATEWRQFCSSKNLPCPEVLPARDVSTLNSCYSQGISPQHPVYAAYREAVLGRRDDDALAALKSIVRLNPKDSSAAEELARLDGKILAGRLAKLDQMLTSDPDSALFELERIESFGFKSEIGGAVWKRGQLARSEKLLAEAEQMRRDDLLPEVLSHLDLLDQLRTDNKLEWPQAWEGRVAEMLAWCRIEGAARQQDEDYAAALAQLNAAILLSEEKDTRARKVTSTELRSDQESIHRLHRRVETFSRPVPDDLVQRFRKRTALIQEKINRLSRARLILIGSIATVCILLLGAAAVAFLGLRGANSLTAELQRATEGHQVRVLQGLIKQSEKGGVITMPELKAATAAATGEVTAQLAVLAEFEAAFKKLPGEPGNPGSVDWFAGVIGQLNQARKAHQALTEDLRAETQPELDGFLRKFAGWCESHLPMINKELDARVGAAEARMVAVAEGQDLDGFRKAVTEEMPSMEKTAQQIAGLGPFFKLRPELADRCHLLVERLTKDLSGLARVDAAVGALGRAGKTEDVVAAVADLAAADVKQSDHVRASRNARAVIGLKPDPDALWRGLLVGTNSALWQSFAKSEELDLTPKKFGFEVRQKYMELARDYAVNGRHYRCRLHLDEKLQTFEEWITDGPLDSSEGWHTVQGWTIAEKGPCIFLPKEFGVFSGRYTSTNRQTFYGITTTDIKALTGVWADAGFARLVDTRNMAYKLPPLKVADSLFAATNSSPILRAFLLNELLGFMAAQPLETGLVFCPQLAAVQPNLRTLGVEQIVSGDWFVPERVKSIGPKFEQLFASHQGGSFFKQASDLLTVTMRAAKVGFDLAGYVRPDGQPAWRTPPVDVAVWGLPEKGDLPTLLFLVKAGDVRKVAKPLPMSPLLVYKGDLASLVQEAGVHRDGMANKRYLPPLFSIPETVP